MERKSFAPPPLPPLRKMRSIFAGISMKTDLLDEQRRNSGTQTPAPTNTKRQKKSACFASNYIPAFFSEHFK